ncbi:hypothetical protein SRHO_G00174650 [Serrasalmus rhombeus]
MKATYCLSAASSENAAPLSKFLKERSVNANFVVVPHHPIREQLKASCDPNWSLTVREMGWDWFVQVQVPPAGEVNEELLRNRAGSRNTRLENHWGSCLLRHASVVGLEWQVLVGKVQGKCPREPAVHQKN